MACHTFNDKRGYLVSLSTTDRNIKRSADLAHSLAAETSNSLHQNRYRNTLNRIKVDGAATTNWILSRLKDDLAWKVTNRRCARCNQRSSQSRDGRVARDHNYGSSLNLRQLAPPDFAPQRQRGHEAAAPARNAARLPHSSDSSIGNSSYAA